MKKLTLIVVGLLTTLLTFSQSYDRVIKSTKLEFINNDWRIVESAYPSELFVIIKDWDITVGTYKLKTYDQPEKTTYDSHIAVTWKAINPTGDKCFFIMKKYRPEITTHKIYSVVYTQYSLMYEYECE